MDLNALLYAHQLAIMRADAAHDCAPVRARHYAQAMQIAGRIRQMPGSMAMWWSVAAATRPWQRARCASEDLHALPRSCNSAASLAVWEGEGGAAAGEVLEWPLGRQPRCPAPTGA